MERIVGPEPGSAAFLVFLPVNIGFLVVIPLGFILLGFGIPRPPRVHAVSLSSFGRSKDGVSLRFAL